MELHASMECYYCSFKRCSFDNGIVYRSECSVSFINCCFEVDYQHSIASMPSMGLCHYDNVPRMFNFQTTGVSFQLIGCCFRENGKPYLSMKEIRKAVNEETLCIMYNRLLSSNTIW